MQLLRNADDEWRADILAKIISIHSFRGGTGKSNTSANIAATLALQGKRVGVVDTDIQSPGIHVLFGLEEDQMGHTLNDYLWGKCGITDAAHDVTAALGSNIPGKVFLVPSSVKAGEIARVLREGYDIGLLKEGFLELMNELELDVLVIDTHPGLNEETLLSVAISDGLAIVMRPDQQDYQGTAVTVEIARKLEVSRMVLVVNKAPSILNPDDLKAKVEQIYKTPVAAVLPHSDEMMNLASAGVFVTKYPNHPITEKIRTVVSLLMAD
jgi:MinD-like ATPase involved in chromosome partitioning or flagellar assembly